MVGRQAGYSKVVGHLFSMFFILVTNRQKETHYDYNAEDDTIEQWFSNFSLLRTPFTAPKTAAALFVVSVS